MVAFLADECLIARCLAGQEDAWTELYGRCQPVLLGQIASWLGPWKRCGELAEEIAARVWLKLIEGGHARLAKFDPAQGTKFTTFLIAIARNEFLMVIRERSRRQAREAKKAESRQSATTDDCLDLDLAEYLEQLDAAEKEMVIDCLGGYHHSPLVAPSPQSPTRLKQSLLQKLRRYLNPDRGHTAPASVVTNKPRPDEKSSPMDSDGGI